MRFLDFLLCKKLIRRDVLVVDRVNLRSFVVSIVLLFGLDLNYRKTDNSLGHGHYCSKKNKKNAVTLELGPRT